MISLTDIEAMKEYSQKNTNNYETKEKKQEWKNVNQKKKLKLLKI